MDEQNFHPWSMVVVFLSLGVVLLLTMMLASGEAMAMHNKAIAMLVFSDEELPDALDEAERAQMIMMRRAMISLENFYTADEHEERADVFACGRDDVPALGGTETAESGSHVAQGGDGDAHGLLQIESAE